MLCIVDHLPIDGSVLAPFRCQVASIKSELTARGKSCSNVFKYVDTLSNYDKAIFSELDLLTTIQKVLPILLVFKIYSKPPPSSHNSYNTSDP